MNSTICYYNCDEIAHISRDYSQPRNVKCSHCLNTGNAKEDPKFVGQVRSVGVIAQF